jgi:hypothetical protein
LKLEPTTMDHLLLGLTCPIIDGRIFRRSALDENFGLKVFFLLCARSMGHVE